MNERYIGAIVAVSLLVSAGWVAAAGQADDDLGRKMRKGPNPVINFEQADVNGDGQLTKNEMTQYAQFQFTRADTNQDGFLDRAELAANIVKQMQNRMKKHQDRMLSKLDANDDGKLSFAELHGAMAERGNKMFERMDRDGNGTLSQDELSHKDRHGKFRRGEHDGKHGHDDDHGREHD